MTQLLGIELDEKDIEGLEACLLNSRDMIERMRPVNMNMNIPRAEVFAWWREVLDKNIADMEAKVKGWKDMMSASTIVEDEKKSTVVKLKKKK